MNNMKKVIMILSIGLIGLTSCGTGTETEVKPVDSTVVVVDTVVSVDTIPAVEVVDSTQK
jgi:hypothetical protein